MNALALNSPEPDRVQATLNRVRAAEMVPFYALEAEVDPVGLDLAIQAAEASLMPVGDARAARGVEYATRLLGAKELAPDLLAGYVAILGALPADLFARAIKDGCSGTTYHKLPVPGVFLAAVKGDLEERRATLNRLLRHKGRIQLVSRMAPRRDNVRTLPRPANVVEATPAE